VFELYDAEATASLRQLRLQSVLYHSLTLSSHVLHRPIVCDFFSWDDMGGLSSAMCTRRLLQHCQYDWLFMTGTCAGNPLHRDLHLGDLIVAGKVIDLHFGKRTEGGGGGVQADTTTLNISHDLRSALDAVREHTGSGTAAADGGGWQRYISESRPQSERWQREQVVKALYDGRDGGAGLSMEQLRGALPHITLADLRLILNDDQRHSPEVFRAELDEATLLTRYRLSDAELRRVRILVGNAGEVVTRDPEQPAIHQGTMGTSMSTVEAGLTPQDWERMASDTGQRGLLGLDMEAYGVYSAIEAHRRERHDHLVQCVLVKGVTDMGDGGRTDRRFHAYCQQLSAAFVKRFVVLHGYESSLRFGHVELSRSVVVEETSHSALNPSSRVCEEAILILG
jgi:nucleoside phosphorylase